MRLALFPLRTVLFPGMSLPLQIFEPRYLSLVRQCRAAGEPFGVVLIRSGPEVGGPAVPHTVGTLADITRVDSLPDGRLTLEAVGRERFRLRSTQLAPEGYLTGTAAVFPLQDIAGSRAAAQADALAPLVTRYLDLLAQAAGSRLTSRPLPADPVALAYLAAIVAQVPVLEKQALLAVRDLPGLLSAERALLRRELSLLRAMLAAPHSKPSGAFSAN
jgi:Lon protease-like protein